MYQGTSLFISTSHCKIKKIVNLLIHVSLYTCGLIMNQISSLSQHFPFYIRSFRFGARSLQLLVHYVSADYCFRRRVTVSRHSTSAAERDKHNSRIRPLFRCLRGLTFLITTSIFVHTTADRTIYFSFKYATDRCSYIIIQTFSILNRSNIFNNFYHKIFFNTKLRL